MTALTLPSLTRPFPLPLPLSPAHAALAAATSPRARFVVAMDVCGFQLGERAVSYLWEYGENLERLAALRTLVYGGGPGTPCEYHCPRRVSVRLAARVALGWAALPDARLDPLTWRELPAELRRELVSNTGN